MDDPFIGTIALFASPRDMKGWLPCDGRAVSAEEHPVLYSALGDPPREQPGDRFRLPKLDAPLPFMRYVMASEGRYAPHGHARPRFEPFIVGMIASWDGTVPAHCLLAEGQTLQITDYQELYSIFGPQHGGDGIKTFRLPDLRPKGRHVICFTGYYPAYP